MLDPAATTSPGMTTAELWANGMAAVALVVSIIALIRTSLENTKANELRADHLKLSQGMSEIALRNQVVESRRQVSEFYADNIDFLTKLKTGAALSTDEEARRGRLKHARDDLIEGYLNALDAACEMYIDGKIDKVRFKKSYQPDIRHAVQHEAHKDHLGPGHLHHALMRVYEEWENPEKS